MDRLTILSINIGLPSTLRYQGKDVPSGLRKRPAEGALFLSWVNLEGDGQADLIHHGGRDKAVCVYPYEHYAHWERELQRTLPFGAFGENLTVQGLPEGDVCIGDTFRFGGAIVQVSQPRQPCFKLSARYERTDLPLLVQETGFTGYYFRVLQEGVVRASDGLVRLASHPDAVTVAFANRIMHREKTNADGMRTLLGVDALSASWRATLQKRLAGGSVDPQERLAGTPGGSD